MKSDQSNSRNTSGNGIPVSLIRIIVSLLAIFLLGFFVFCTIRAIHFGFSDLDGFLLHRARISHPEMVDVEKKTEDDDNGGVTTSYHIVYEYEYKGVLYKAADPSDYTKYPSHGRDSFYVDSRNPEKIFSRHHVLGSIAQTLAGVIPLVLLILGGIASFKYRSSRKREKQLRAEREEMLNAPIQINLSFNTFCTSN